MPSDELTARRKAIRQCVADGMTHRQLAQRLGVSEANIKQLLQREAPYSEAAIRLKSYLQGRGYWADATATPSTTCPQCGTVIGTTCPQCGTTVPLGSNFCWACGTPTT